MARSQSSIERDERAIMEATVDALLAAGYHLAIWNGEDDGGVYQSRDREHILANMRQTDDEYLKTNSNRKTHHGWVRFVYGNSGWDVISDYTMNLETVLAPVNALADSLS